MDKVLAVLASDLHREAVRELLTLILADRQGDAVRMARRLLDLSEDLRELLRPGLQP
jgi:hypothetical protein